MLSFFLFFLFFSFCFLFSLLVLLLFIYSPSFKLVCEGVTTMHIGTCEHPEYSPWFCCEEISKNLGVTWTRANGHFSITAAPNFERIWWRESVTSRTRATSDSGGGDSGYAGRRGSVDSLSTFCNYCKYLSRYLLTCLPTCSPCLRCRIHICAKPNSLGT